MKKKILLLTTGGTIASAPTESGEGLAPAITGSGIHGMIGGIISNYDVTVRDILSLDSSNIQPEEWKINACHNIADNGADLILGDHPHVLQPMEEYNGVSIVYSLGNFCFGGNMHPENRTIIFNQTLSITKDKNNNTFNINGITIDITPCYVYTGEINNWQPAIIDDEEAAAKVLDFMNQITDSPL